MENVSPKSRTTLALLAFFLGSVGVHRFYTGKNGSGAVQLIVSLILFFSIIGWLFLGIWPLIDTIIVLCGNWKDENGLPVKTW